MLNYCFYFLNILSLILTTIGFTFLGRRFLTDSDFDNWLVLTSLVGLLNVCDFGVSRFISREASHKDKMNELLPGALLFHFFVAIIITLISSIVINYYASSKSYSVGVWVVFVLSFFCKQFCVDLFSYFYGKNNILFERVARFTLNLVLFLCGFLTLYNTHSLLLFLLSHVSVYFAGSLILLKVFLKTEGLMFHHLGGKANYRVRQFIKGSWLTMKDFTLSSLPTYFIMNFGVVYVRGFVSGEEFRFWGVVSQLTGGFLMIAHVFNQVKGPTYTKLFFEGEMSVLRSLFKKNVYVSTVIVSVGVFIVVLSGNYIFTLWELTYVPSNFFLAIWCFFLFFESLQMVFASLLIRIGYVRFYPFVLVSAFINIFLLKYLVPEWGVEGVVVSLFISQFLTCHIFIPLRALKIILKESV